MKVIKYNAKENRFYSIGRCPQPEEDNSPLGTCVRALNCYIETLSHAFEYGNLEKRLVECINRGISVIDDNQIFFELNKQNIQELKEEFTKIMKKIFIQKIYEIDDKEISPKYDKFFRSDEKRWKRIKMFGKHLFSTKATLKGQINALFQQFVNNNINNEKMIKWYKEQFNNLFDKLQKHIENKAKKINNQANTQLDNNVNNGCKAINIQ